MLGVVRIGLAHVDSAQRGVDRAGRPQRGPRSPGAVACQDPQVH